MHDDKLDGLVYIRDLTQVSIDLETYVNWLRNVQENRFIESASIDYTISDLSNYLHAKLSSSDVKFWGIFLKSGEFIGTVKLDPIDFGQGTAWLGIMIGDKAHRGKGYGLSALKQVAEYSESILFLRKLYLGVHRENTAAIKLYKQFGFRVTDYREFSLIMTKHL